MQVRTMSALFCAEKPLRCFVLPELLRMHRDKLTFWDLKCTAEKCNPIVSWVMSGKVCEAG